jgi:hypothetical protein
MYTCPDRSRPASQLSPRVSSHDDDLEFGDESEADGCLTDRSEAALRRLHVVEYLSYLCAPLALLDVVRFEDCEERKVTAFER